MKPQRFLIRGEVASGKSAYVALLAAFSRNVITESMEGRKSLMRRIHATRQAHKIDPEDMTETTTVIIDDVATKLLELGFNRDAIFDASAIKILFTEAAKHGAGSEIYVQNKRRGEEAKACPSFLNDMDWIIDIERGEVGVRHARVIKAVSDTDALALSFEIKSVFHLSAFTPVAMPIVRRS